MSEETIDWERGFAEGYNLGLEKGKAVSLLLLVHRVVELKNKIAELEAKNKKLEAKNRKFEASVKGVK
jgi:uncharacterized protein YhaN